MNFQDLQKVENPDFYLDVAFRRAKEAAERAKGRQPKIKVIKGQGRTMKNPDQMSQERRSQKVSISSNVELVRIDAVNANLTNAMENILKKFPLIDDLPRFYFELIRCTLEYEDLKNSLGSVNWAVMKLKEFHRKYHSLIRNCKDLKKISEYRKEFYGRAASVMKQIKRQLAYLDEARKIMKEYPNVKTSVMTVAIVGFPNVGKTTLMYKLTGSKPEINSYAFTTKGINVGYIGRDKAKKDRIQILDTPGTLNRFEKMNKIERQAYLAMRYVAHALVYVFDLTEPYPLQKQEGMHEKIKEHGKDIIIYVSKADITAKEKINELAKKYDIVTDAEELKERIMGLKKPAELGQDL